MGSQRVGHDRAQAQASVCRSARTCAYILFQILFPYRLLQNIVYSSLCCTVGLCYLSTLYTVMCMYMLTGVSSSVFEFMKHFLFTTQRTPLAHPHSSLRG